MTHAEKAKYLDIFSCPWTDGIETRYSTLGKLNDGVIELWKEIPSDSLLDRKDKPVAVLTDDLLEQWAPVVTGTKFAIAEVMDQTWGYWDGTNFTIVPREAVLFDTREEATEVMEQIKKEWEAALRISAADPENPHRALHQGFLDREIYKISNWLEAVADEAEFRSRPDTW